MREIGRKALTSLRSAARDIVLIVLSILIAFWLDGWQERRAERRLLRQHLGALVNEFDQTRLQLEEELQSVMSSAEGSAAVLRLMVGEGPADPDRVHAAALQSMSAGIFTAQDPVLTAMLASGELLDLQSDSLMSRLVEWRHRLEHVRTDSGHLERNREQTLTDRQVALGRSFGAFTRAEPEWDRLYGDPETLLSDGGLAVAFIWRHERAARLESSYRAALEESAAIIELLQEEMQRLGAR